MTQLETYDYINKTPYILSKFWPHFTGGLLDLITKYPIFTVLTKNPTEIRNLIYYLPYAKPLRATGVLTTIKVFFPVTDYAKQYS